jgi:hypothetical protein
VTNTHIEVEDRGITLSKQLAWAMMIGITTGSLYIGSTLGKLEAAVQQITASQRIFEDKMDREIVTIDSRANETLRRMRVLEANSAREQERMASLLAALDKIDKQLSAISDRLRKAETGNPTGR